MAKLGYTFYPKDWGNSESVFELNLAERGLYRELIDLAMMNDNKTNIKKDVWCRKFAVSLIDIEAILDKLSLLKLIEIKSEILFIPSCENRLNLVRGGKKGGSKKKPTYKPILKPIESLEIKSDKPIVKQIEKETKIEKEIKSKNDFYFNELVISQSWLESVAMKSKPKFNVAETKIKLKEYTEMLNNKFDFKINKTQYASHFVSWLDLQQKNDKPFKQPLI